MRKKLSKNIKGFTIIEVLIVLAIAAVIMLIVFLAVPALQRNNRNTQRKSDAAALLGGVSEYVSNNEGRFPNVCSGTGGITLTRVAPTKPTEVELGYYNQAACAAIAGNAFPGGNGTPGLRTAFGAVAAGTLDSAAEDYIFIVPEAACSGDAVVAGSARQFAAVFEIETGTNTYSQVCQSS